MRLLQAIHLLDLWTFDWCLKRKHRDLFVTVSRWVSRSADGYLYLFISLFFMAFQEWDIVKILALGFLIERPIYFVLKNQLKRNRPQQTIPGYQSVIQPSDQFSFPSGHTSAAFLVASILAASFPVLTIPLFTWAVWVGIARVMLGVHFPTDIVAGALLGYSTFHICSAILG